MENHQKHKHLTVTDFLVTGESFDLIYDNTRDLLITTPKPAPTEIAKYYDSEEYISHTDSKAGLIAFLYQWVKRYSLRKKVKLITELNNGAGSLLDIGAGTGDFLLCAKQSNWKVTGVEVNEKARIFARNKKIILSEELEDYVGQQFDVITLWHVLEHLPNLEESIKTIESLIKPGGILVIAVPNFRSYDALKYGRFWAAYDVPRHLWHFSRKAMTTLFSKKLVLTKINPMVFDSFYVSLLSEKYRSGKSFSISALLIGLWSNILAWRSREYSSLIYCFKKTN